MNAPAPLRQSLLAHSDSVFKGPNGDYASVLEALEGVSAAQAVWKPAPHQNSIWQIVDHLIGSKEWLIEMLEEGQAKSPPWTEPSGDEEAWQAVQSRLIETHRRLQEALARLPEADLLKIPSKENHMLLELILSSGPAHEAHHSGQIDYLKGLQARGSVHLQGNG